MPATHQLSTHIPVRPLTRIIHCASYCWHLKCHRTTSVIQVRRWCNAIGFGWRHVHHITSTILHNADHYTYKPYTTHPKLELENSNHRSALTNQWHAWNRIQHRVASSMTAMSLVDTTNRSQRKYTAIQILQLEVHSDQNHNLIHYQIWIHCCSLQNRLFAQYLAQH